MIYVALWLYLGGVVLMGKWAQKQPGDTLGRILAVTFWPFLVPLVLVI